MHDTIYCSQLDVLFSHCYMISFRDFPLLFKDKNSTMDNKNLRDDLNAQVDGNKDTFRDLRSKKVEIHDNYSKLRQRSTIQRLEKASELYIPISCVYLAGLSPRVDESGLNLILQSGLSLSILSSLQKLEIGDVNRRLTNEELAAILSYSSQCKSLKDMLLQWYYLPDTIPVGSIPSSLKSRKLKVWNRINYDRFCRLNLQTGQWQACDGFGNLPGEEGFDERSYQLSLSNFNHARHK
ncbi:uncharacterized protein [Apostichopus japonicus]|uniref:uncharacterized protein n=1 Tax=Stichopus japonicus TaxID=307972 RepID=UPI003AB8B676